MTHATRWHPAQQELQSYADAACGALVAASVEQHLLTCTTCRAHVALGVQRDRLETVAQLLDDRLDHLERPWAERLLRRLGVAEVDARVLLSAPSVRIAWGVAVAAAALLALLVAGQDADGRTVFLLLAPLLPAGATAVAYAPQLDPALAIVSASPYRASRLVLIRSLAVGITAAISVGLASFVVPGWGSAAAAWLLPALALTLAVLALSPWLGTGNAAALVGGAWSVLVLGLERSGSDPLLTYSASGQLISAAVAALALAAVVGRWQRLDDGGWPR
ncbi:MAG: hypothetical protein JJD92_06405 [Frankiaceae bacterium]|nr:hypothetical protein [Frankiaceae bacterium]